MKKVLITGAAGFVGSHLSDYLLSQGYAVTALDRVPLDQAFTLQNAKKNSNFQYTVGDILDRKKLEQVFTEKFDYVYHLASVVGVHKYMDDPFGLIDITILGTRNIAEFAQKNGAKIVFTSTSEVFGKNPKVPWQEDDDRVLGSTQVDRWSYSASKGVCEHMLLGLHKKTEHPVTIVRYFNAYGPRQNPIFVVSQSVHRVLNGMAPLLYDTGNQTRCFTYIEDSVQGTVTAATHANGNGQVFNIGNNQEMTIRQIIEVIIKASGKNFDFSHLDTGKTYGKIYEDVTRRVPDVSKAKTLLGWEAKIKPEEGIQRTMNWSKENDWWLKIKPTSPS